MRELRRALRLSAPKFGAIIGVKYRAVQYHEAPADGVHTHWCMTPASQRLLLEYLTPRRDYLEAEGIPWPWVVPPSPPVQICQHCGKDTRTHRRCGRCRVLIGPGHIPVSTTHTLLCHMCGTWVDNHRVAQVAAIAAAVR